MRMKYEQTGKTRSDRGRSTPTNVSINAELVAEARALGVNISRASAAGLEAAVAEARAEQWLRENRAALEASNAYVEARGLPLASLRQF
jgi:antitoxin CcdA